MIVPQYSFRGNTGKPVAGEGHVFAVAPSLIANSHAPERIVDKGKAATFAPRLQFRIQP